MGQTLIVAGALGVSAAGAAYGARRLSERALGSKEPRHAPGNFEAAQAWIQHSETARTAEALGQNDSGTWTAPPAGANSGMGHAGNTALPVAKALQVSAATTSAETPLSEDGRVAEVAGIDHGRSERSRMVDELRAVRERVARERQEREEVLRKTQGGQLSSGKISLSRCGRTPQEEAALAFAEAAREQARQEYQCPEWLKTEGCVNIAVTGNSGVGKSSCINSVRGLRASDEGAAKVSAIETTLEPRAFDFERDSCVPARLWDLPGAGTKRFPRDTYIKRMGLRYFDVVLVLTASRYTETEIAIARELERFGVPHFMVRNKVDFDIANSEDDHGMSPEETLAAIRADMQRQGVTRPYLTSSKFSRRTEFDMTQLIADAFQAICEARNMPVDWMNSPAERIEAST
eukprot:TRINITY_DN27603_c0_g1_i1.p1 TRINITY_DN27603_c0_g1~~TRINITY_DN27603_c0_g1_i1.p1  ORF type:complete len:405 (+),score=44.10 TRINITY_DN27603_c0_g1_i1:44-1258(+)